MSASGGERYTFAVSEIMSGNRVLVTVYVRIERHVHVTMTLYGDPTMRDGEKILDVHLLNERNDEHE